MRNDWPHHKPTCEIIYENKSYVAPLIRQMETKESLTKDELMLTIGAKTQSNFTDEELFKEPHKRGEEMCESKSIVHTL
jgi:hypothetical protein